MFFVVVFVGFLVCFPSKGSVISSSVSPDGISPALAERARGSRDLLYWVPVQGEARCCYVGAVSSVVILP